MKWLRRPSPGRRKGEQRGSASQGPMRVGVATLISCVLLADLGVAQPDTPAGSAKEELAQRSAVFAGEVLCPWAIPFEIGEQYLIYGDCVRTAVYTDTTTTTRRLEDAREDLRELGPAIRARRRGRP